MPETREKCTAELTNSADKDRLWGDAGGNQTQGTDAVEAALADAIGKAAAAGAWEAVTALTAELRARREARSKVVSLDAARVRRKR